MALNPTNFETYFNDATTGLYRDGQGAGSITPEDHRDLVTEIKESFNNKIESLLVAVDVSVSGTLNFRNENRHLKFYADEVISSAFEFDYSNSAYYPDFTLFIVISGTPVITFPPSFLFSDVRVALGTGGVHEFTPVEEGVYKFKGEWGSAAYHVDIFGPYN